MVEKHPPEKARSLANCTAQRSNGLHVFVDLRSGPLIAGAAARQSYFVGRGSC